MPLDNLHYIHSIGAFLRDKMLVVIRSSIYGDAVICICSIILETGYFESDTVLTDA